MLMTEHFHRLDFKPDSRQVFAELFLIHNLDGDLLSGCQMDGLFDLGEAACSNSFVEVIDS